VGLGEGEAGHCCAHRVFRSCRRYVVPLSALPWAAWVHPDRESLEEAVAVAWGRLTDYPETIISLRLFDWISEGTD
jgi:hypothetical protein